MLLEGRLVGECAWLLNMPWFHNTSYIFSHAPRAQLEAIKIRISAKGIDSH